eukprot:g27688.t1
MRHGTRLAAASRSCAVQGHAGLRHLRSSGRLWPSTGCLLVRARWASEAVRPPWQSLRRGEILRGRLHVPSFQTDVAYVVFPRGARAREEDLWIPVTGFAGAGDRCVFHTVDR